MERMKLPIGIEEFSEIRKKNFYYVDKSELIAKLIRNGAHVNLFTRPRRFGKSLTMSMLKYFFEIGTDAALFGGLAISKEKELCERHMGQYPVISLSFKDIDGETYDKSYAKLKEVISVESDKYRGLLKSGKISSSDKSRLEALIYKSASDADFQFALSVLSRILYAHYGKKAILLIDEYDVPLNNANKFGYYGKTAGLIRGLLSSGLKGNDSLELAVLTGCLRISKESIFTGLNNLKVNSIADSGYGEYFGFTESEVAELLKYYGLESHMDEMREWYDGYRFGKANVYCPWDVINYCFDLTVDPETNPKLYWINTSGNDVVRSLINIADMSTQKEIEHLISGGTMEKSVHTELTYQDIDKDKDNLWNVLYTTGYLTLAEDRVDGRQKLKIPNKEVRQVYILQIQEWFKTAIYGTDCVKNLCKAFLERDAKKVETNLNAVLRKTISILDTKAKDAQKENFYHGLLIGLLRSKGDWIIESNAESGDGFCDILIEPDDPNTGYVLELKYVSDYSALGRACQNAIKQIKNKRYDERLRGDGRVNIGAYGIAFCKKRCEVLFETL